MSRISFLSSPFHLDADSSCSFTQRQDGVVLTSVQPGDGQFCAGGPFHHGDVILPPGRDTRHLCTHAKTKMLFLFIQGCTSSRCSPYSGVIGSLHYQGVQGTVEAHHRQLHFRVFLSSLKHPSGHKTGLGFRSASISLKQAQRINPTILLCNFGTEE